MPTTLEPKASEFETVESASSYDLWFRSKVEASLARADQQGTERFSSDEVKHTLEAVIKAAQTKDATRRLA